MKDTIKVQPKESGGKKKTTIRSTVTKLDSERHNQAARNIRHGRELQTLVENLPDAISRFDLEGRYLYVNPAQARLIGLPPEDILGMNLRDLPGPDQVEEGRISDQQFKQILEDPKEYTVEYQALTPQGLCWLQSREVPEFASDGSLESVLVVTSDITEHRQAEQALRESEARYRVLFESARDAIFILDYDRFSDCNMPAIKMFGGEQASLIGQTPYDKFSPQIQPNGRPSKDAALEKINAALTGHPQYFEWRHRRLDGTLFDTEISLNQVKIGNGTFLQAIVRDITERKRAEAQIRFLSRLPDESPNPILRVAIDGTLLYANPVSKPLLAKWDTHVGQPVSKAWQAGISEIFQSGTHREVEFKSDEKVFSLILAPIVDAGYVNVYGRDITERKRAEEALRQSDDKLRAIFAAMTDVIIVFDSDGRYMEIAPTNQINLYRPTPDMLGKSVVELFPPETADFFLKNIHQTLETKELTNLEYSLRIRDKEIWFSAGVSPLSPNTVIWTAHDITYRKQSEYETEKHLAELEAINSISTALRGAKSVDEMLPHLLDKSLKVMGTDVGDIWLFDPINGRLRQTITRGLLAQASKKDLAPGEGIAGYVYKTGEPYISSDLKMDPMISSIAAPDMPAGWGGICVPIRAEQETIGVLCIYVRLPRQLGQNDANLLTTISEISGNAIRRIRLYEETVHQVQRLASLRSIDTAIISVLDMRMVLDILLGHITNQLAVDAADILLLNAPTHTLEFAAGHGFRTNGIERSRLRLDEGLAGRVAREKKLLNMRDLADAGANFVRLPLLSGEAFVTYFGVPLIIKGQVRGVLEIFNRSTLTPDTEWLGFLETLAGQAAIAIDNSQMFENLQSSNFELMLAYDETIEGWSQALDLRDKETEGHSQRVTEMTLRLAGSLGFTPEEMIHIHRGALLHDIGKMGVPDNILRKPGPLTDEEWVIMRKHPLFSYELLIPISYLRPALDIPYCHHEKWDGSGYPRGLKGDQIPLAARVFAVVDVWDALMSDRPYRKAWSRVKALAYIQDQAGKYFDSRVVDTFLTQIDPAKR